MLVKLPFALAACTSAVTSLRGGLSQITMSADCPSIVVGGGRIGSMLHGLGGHEGDVLLRRGEPFPSTPAEGPIYVTTRNDDLQGVIDATPEHRREDLVRPSFSGCTECCPPCDPPDLSSLVHALRDIRNFTQVFMQNGMLGKFLESNGLASNTQVLLYLAVAKLGEPPIDGITEFNPEGLTAATGKWANAFASRLDKGGLKCRALDGNDYTAAMLEKHVWICAFMLTGALNGGITVGEVEEKHSEQLKSIIDELIAAGEESLGVKLPAGPSTDWPRTAVASRTFLRPSRRCVLSGGSSLPLPSRSRCCVLTHPCPCLILRRPSCSSAV